jgi:hypothetical protein
MNFSQPRLFGGVHGAIPNAHGRRLVFEVDFQPARWNQTPESRPQVSARLVNAELVADGTHGLLERFLPYRLKSRLFQFE